MEAKIDKSTATLFSQTCKVPENKLSLFFYFWPLDQDIDDMRFGPV